MCDILMILEIPNCFPRVFTDVISTSVKLSDKEMFTDHMTRGFQQRLKGSEVSI